MSATPSNPESAVEEQPVHPDSYDTGAGLDEGAAEQPMNPADEIPPPAETPDPAQSGAPAAPAPAQAATPPKPVNHEEQIKAVQAWATKVAQENAELRKKAGSSQPPPPSAERAPQDQPPNDGYDWTTFNKLLEEQGREAAFEHRDAWKDEQLLRKVDERTAQRERQNRIDSETTRLFQAHQVQNADIEVMQTLAQHDLEQGFNPSPGALLALRLGGGSWDEVAKRLATGSAAAAAPAAPATPHPAHPGAPGSAAPRSPAPARKRSLQIPARSVGL
jgi:hypothetical protein